MIHRNRSVREALFHTSSAEPVVRAKMTVHIMAMNHPGGVQGGKISVWYHSCP
jgi:hypothetical protein